MLHNHKIGRKRIYRSRREQREKMEVAGDRASKLNWFQKSGATNIFRIPQPQRAMT